MTRQQYDAEVKAQAVARVRRKTPPASRMAEELGVPRKTQAGRQHPTEPFVGRGRLRAEDQRMRERERTVRDRQEETAILKKAMRLVANGQT
jgi:transposase